MKTMEIDKYCRRHDYDFRSAYQCPYCLIDDYEIALRMIAAQDSGIVASSARSDCMAAIAKQALRAIHE